ncbi:MAG: hypothetical protein Q8888_02340 [Vigna little leaf phytoplasma]|nr:hypothetical protein [Vigna little leaf phytoplasma]
MVKLLYLCVYFRPEKATDNQSSERNSLKFVGILKRFYFDVAGNQLVFLTFFPLGAKDFFRTPANRPISFQCFNFPVRIIKIAITITSDFFKH